MEYIRARGGDVLLRSSVTAIGLKQDRVGVLTGSGEQRFDFAVLAAPFQNVASLLPADAASEPIKQQLAHFEPSSITGIHLWFDHEITPLPHAVLLDRTIQWMFHKSKFHEGREQGTQGSYIELVVSASKSLVQKSREEILDLATRELAEFFPAVREAKLVKSTVIKEIYATYAILPGLDKFRPEAKLSGRASFSPATGLRQVGQPLWRARCAADILRLRLLWKIWASHRNLLLRTCRQRD